MRIARTMETVVLFADCSRARVRVYFDERDAIVGRRWDAKDVGGEWVVMDRERWQAYVDRKRVQKRPLQVVRPMSSPSE